MSKYKGYKEKNYDLNLEPLDDKQESTSAKTDPQPKKGIISNCYRVVLRERPTKESNKLGILLKGTTCDIIFDEACPETCVKIEPTSGDVLTIGYIPKRCVEIVEE